MKIFSLQTKKYLVIWSLLLGLVLMVGIYQIQIPRTCQIPDVPGPSSCYQNGFPLSVAGQQATGPAIPSLLVDFVFWILVAFIFLSLTGYFIKKKQVVSS